MATATFGDKNQYTYNVDSKGTPYGNPIVADKLNSPAPLQTITPTPDPLTANGVGQGIIDSAISGITTSQADVVKAQADTKAKLDRVAELQKQDALKGTDLASQYDLNGLNTEQTNLDKYNQQLNDINASVSGLSNEAKAIPMVVQEKNKNTGATDAGIAPQTAGMLRENAIKALTQSSLADITTANISNSTVRYNSALAKSQRAIDLKYAPIETEIANLKNQLELNKTYITDPAEKKLLEQQSIVLNERTRLIAEKKATDQELTKTITDGITGGAIPDATKAYDILGRYNAGNLTIADAYKELGLTNSPTAVVKPTQTLASAIGKVESGGNDYSAIGTKITKGQNAGYSALGKYQIMPNLWFDAIGLDGSSATDRQKFLDTPELQDKLFEYIISSLDKKYNGNQDKVIASYFGGSQGASVVGTPAGDKITDGNLSINQYVAKVKGNLESNTPKFEQYGSLANTTFDPTNTVDRNANQYISNYIKNATMPTAISLGIGTRSTKPAQQKEFQTIQQRANNLYFEATGQSLPDVQILKSNKALIAKNNAILNNNILSSEAMVKNFDLAINGEITNDVNQNATIVNKILNPIYLALGDPAVNQAMVSNGTITQEFANLISIRNQSGTLMADKEMASELIRFGTSVEAQKAVVERLKAEASNIHTAVQDANNSLWQQTDPLKQDANNPLRQQTINSNSGISNGVDLNNPKFWKKQ